MKNKSEVTDARRGEGVIGKGAALAVALSMLLAPVSLSGANERSALSEEKQYSMEDSLPGPKQQDERGSEAQLSSSEPGELPEEKQVSMQGEAAKSGDAADRSREAVEVTAGSIEPSYETKAPMRTERLTNVTSWKGSKVSSEEGETLGRIEDTVLDAQSGQVTHVLIDNKGLFAGSRLVPVSQLSREGADGSFVLAAKIDGSSEDRMYSETGNLEEPMVSERSQGEDREFRGRESIRPGQVRSSDLIGRSVASKSGKEIGEIESVVQIPDTRDAYVIVDGFQARDWKLNSDAEKVALRVPALALDGDVVELAVSGDEPDFGSAPSLFESEHDKWYLHNGYDIIVVKAESEDYASR
ncbi:PRC-barrel domain-containing protein [Pelagicoccus sp. SDUM812005]|uniref:PRC-barrel domain-containing protein n=1 Tax=Pelagicoccus sp. SDUM812005 TaxID=3041257 RepID=UPI00280D6870|nr:PRC-barrel domain-containing protein [Pelagicoccus sp. SDUM812005]MDQ8181048.1 PRC-barrel domain-containing protein [Pelagicoccus sp. SDUM812005]